MNVCGGVVISKWGMRVSTRVIGSPRGNRRRITSPVQCGFHTHGLPQRPVNYRRTLFGINCEHPLLGIRFERSHGRLAHSVISKIDWDFSRLSFVSPTYRCFSVLYSATCGLDRIRDQRPIIHWCINGLKRNQCSVPSQSAGETSGYLLFSHHPSF